MDPITRSSAAARLARLALVAAALPLAAASSGFVAEPPPSPATGYVYYGEAPPGGAWTVKNFDNLTRADAPVFQASGPRPNPAVEIAIQAGDVLRARGVVNVRERPWEKRAEEPAVIGSLRPGERVVIREIRPVWLGTEYQRMGFWIRYEHPPRPR